MRSRNEGRQIGGVYPVTRSAHPLSGNCIVFCSLLNLYNPLPKGYTNASSSLVAESNADVKSVHREFQSQGSRTGKDFKRSWTSEGPKITWTFIIV